MAPFNPQDSRAPFARLSLVLLPLLLMGAIAFAVWLWQAADEVPQLGQVVGTGTARIGGPYTLTDQNGHVRSSRDFAGRYQLIYFGYTFCPDVCPTTLALMADALGKAGPKAARVVPIFITIDPERDTRDVLRRYLRAFGPRFVGLTGDLSAIRKVAAGYGVYFRKRPTGGGNYGLDHSGVIYLMGPDGKFIAYWDDTAIGPDKLAAELRARVG